MLGGNERGGPRGRRGRQRHDEGGEAALVLDDGGRRKHYNERSGGERSERKADRSEASDRANGESEVFDLGSNGRSP